MASMTPDIRRYEKICGSGWILARKVIYIDFPADKLLYVEDTQEMPNVLFETTVTAFKRWMRGTIQHHQAIEAARGMKADMYGENGND